ncbi:hypothetical protein H7H82_20725 [Mycobacterium heidelbergense]|uniref:hypothetical protein n=1 Tax=Mycobacterium heidelbergense TaxID=53376 RepID=UPI0013D67F81|nr:hypothetical protein [Mycobacterium heidelbergense]MCV7052983.1 hypothetical protein [Mycobacterium heidelbergense]
MPYPRRYVSWFVVFAWFVEHLWFAVEGVPGRLGMRCEPGVESRSGRPVSWTYPWRT